MKTTMTTMVLGMMVAGAFAQEATPDGWMSETRSVLGRGEVRAEAMQLRASGELARIDDPGYLPTIAGAKLRAEVVAELHRARDSGEFAALAAEAHDFAAAPRGAVYASRTLLAGAR